jgi:hypothetical protein
MSRKGPTFMKVYVVPVLLFNFLIGGWTILALHVIHGIMVYLGYGVIITVGLRLYLAYLDGYDSCSTPRQNSRGREESFR